MEKDLADLIKTLEQKIFNIHYNITCQNYFMVDEIKKQIKEAYDIADKMSNVNLSKEEEKERIGLFWRNGLKEYKSIWDINDKCDKIIAFLMEEEE